MACLFPNAGAAQALNTKSWVSGTGDDTNLCTRASPCLTFARALTRTNAGGSINCVDQGDFGQLLITNNMLLITKAITIDCTGTFAGVLATGGATGIRIDAADTDVVTLRGLSIEGAGTGKTGVDVGQVGALHMEQCKVFGFTGYGIAFFGPTGVGTELYISDSVISNNGTSGGPYSGIIVTLNGTATARISLSNVNVDNNNNGLFLEMPFDATGRMSFSMRDSTAAGNSRNGIEVLQYGAPITAVLDNVTATTNNTGLLVSGPDTRVLITRLTAIANFIGLSIFDSGVIVSYGDNHINNNISMNGTPTVMQMPQ